jgi:hypothetical protein
MILPSLLPLSSFAGPSKMIECGRPGEFPKRTYSGARKATTENKKRTRD